MSPIVREAVDGVLRQYGRHHVEGILKNMSPWDAFKELRELAVKGQYGTSTKGSVRVVCGIIEKVCPNNRVTDDILRHANLSLTHTELLRSIRDVLTGGTFNETNDETNTGVTPMSHLPKYAKDNVVQVTLVRGVDASTMSESDFIQAIEAIQAEIKGFAGLPASSYISKRIELLKNDLVILVSLMDTLLSE